MFANPSPPPPPPPRIDASVHSGQLVCIHGNSDISHPSRRSHCPFRIIILFNADYYTPRQYELRIRNPCITTGIAVNFTAHTLWRASLFLQRILVKIRAHKQNFKKKIPPLLFLFSPFFPLFPPPFFF